MSTTETNEVPSPTAEVLDAGTVPLDASHRCDRCGGQAYVEVEIYDKGEAHDLFGLAEDPEAKAKRVLLFCAHHFTKHTDTLKAQANRIVDHTGLLKSDADAARTF
jgi:hypothetical protein